MFDGDGAWADLEAGWKIKKANDANMTFSTYIAVTLGVTTNAYCQNLDGGSCEVYVGCSSLNQGPGVDGQVVPAGYEIWNSFVVIHQVFSQKPTVN